MSWSAPGPKDGYLPRHCSNSQGCCGSTSETALEEVTGKLHSEPLAFASLLDGMMSTPQHQLLQCLFEGVRLWPITWVAQEGTLEELMQGQEPPQLQVRPLREAILATTPW